MMYRNCSVDATAGAAKAPFNDFSSLSGKPGSAALLWRIAAPTLPAIEFPKGPRPPQTGSLFHKSLAAQVREIVLHARGVAVVGKLGEIHWWPRRETCRPRSSNPRRRRQPTESRQR